MDNQQYQKFVSVSYVVVSSLVAFILFSVLKKVSGFYDLETKIKTIDYIVSGASIFIGFISFFVLYRNETSNTFMGEVAVELLSKVTWPAYRDTIIATVVVLVAVAIATMVLGVFDWGWAQLIRKVL